MADKPVTREEKYLAYLTGDYTGELPKPITRKEKYLYELCLKGMGGEISPEEIKNAVNEYLEKNPVLPGATTEQAQQIEQNKTDVASLKQETGSLKSELGELNNTVFSGSKTEYLKNVSWKFITNSTRIQTTYRQNIQNDFYVEPLTGTKVLIYAYSTNTGSVAKTYDWMKEKTLIRCEYPYYSFVLANVDDSVIAGLSFSNNLQVYSRLGESTFDKMDNKLELLTLSKISGSLPINGLWVPGTLTVNSSTKKVDRTYNDKVLRTEKKLRVSEQSVITVSSEYMIKAFYFNDDDTVAAYTDYVSSITVNTSYSYFRLLLRRKDDVAIECSESEKVILLGANAFFYDGYEKIPLYEDWRVGGADISSSTNVTMNSSNKRMMTCYYHTFTSDFVIECKTGYEVLILPYDKDKKMQGAIDWRKNRFYTKNSYSYYKFLLRKSDNGVMTYADRLNVSIYGSTIDDTADIEYNGVLIFEDDFNASALNRNIWNIERGFYRTSNGQYYVSENVMVKDSNLVFKAERKSYKGFNWISGRVNSNRHFDVKHGRIEARIKLSGEEGIFPAFWTLGSDYYFEFAEDTQTPLRLGQDWPYCGEIDVFEYHGTDAFVTSNCHWSDENGEHLTFGSIKSVPIDVKTYHVYAMEWDERKIKFSVDGDVHYVVKTGDISTNGYEPFNHAHYLILNLAMDNDVPESVKECYMYTDWVRVYSLDNSPTNCTQLQFNECKVSLNVGDTIMLEPTILPGKTHDNTITWESSDANVATVYNGKVTKIKKGNAIIKAITRNGIAAECVIND